MATFTSQINGKDIYAKRAEATRSGVNLEAFTPSGGTKVPGILPEDLGTPGTADGTLATQQYVIDQLGTLADALVYKGTIAGGDTGDYGALTPAAGKGDVYKVSTAGKIDGVDVEVGDMLICNTDNTAAATSSDYTKIAANWDVIQTNIDGVVIGPASAAGNNIAVFDGTTGKLIKDGEIAIENIKTKQTAVSVTGGTLKGVASFSQNDNGVATLVLNDIQDGTTSQKGVVQLQDTIGASEAEDGKAATPKAVRNAITGAVAALDADVTSAPSTKVQVEVVEADGIVTGVTVTETGLDTALATKADKVTSATVGNFAGLDANGNLTDSGYKHSDYKTKQAVYTASGLGTLKTITALTQDANGEISTTASDIQAASTSQSGVVQLAGSIGATVSTENNKAASEKAVRDAINALDATNVTGASNGIIVKVTEADGIITNVTVEATAATAGGAAGLVSYKTEELPD